MPDKIALHPNEPITLKLLDPYADSCTMYDQERGIGEYRTTDGRILALPRAAVLKLNELDPQPGEEIGVARYDRKNGRRGVEWAVWLTASAEKERAAQEEAEVPSDELILLEASVKRESARKQRNGRPVPIRKDPAPATEPAQPRLFDQRGTGTDGPVPQLSPAASAIPLPAQHKRPPDVIPWNVAFREVAQFVAHELAASKLQWSDEAQQAAVCTVLIAEVKKGRIGLWER